jgi:hypothetical protein
MKVYHGVVRLVEDRGHSKQSRRFARIAQMPQRLNDPPDWRGEAAAETHRLAGDERTRPSKIVLKP